LNYWSLRNLLAVVATGTVLAVVYQRHRTAEGADIVGCLRVASRLVGVSDFKVGHVDIDNAVHESEGIRRIVGTGAMDQRKAQAALNRVQNAL